MTSREQLYVLLTYHRITGRGSDPKIETVKRLQKKYGVSRPLLQKWTNKLLSRADAIFLHAATAKRQSRRDQENERMREKLKELQAPADEIDYGDDDFPRV